MQDRIRTTIELTTEQRDFFNTLEHGQMKLVINNLIDLYIELHKKYGFVAIGLLSERLIRLSPRN